MKTSVIRENMKIIGKVTTYNNGDKVYRNASNNVIGKYDYSTGKYRRK